MKPYGVRITSGATPRWLWVTAAAMVASLVAVLGLRSAPALSEGRSTPDDKSLAVWLHAGEHTAVGKPTGSNFRTGLEDLPASLRGTDVDGSLEEDAAGNLKITRGVRNLFDYFLSARGEQPDAVLQDRMRAYIRSHLKTTAAQQALSLMTSYLTYMQQLDEAMKAMPADNLDALKARLAAIERMRAANFAPDVVTAFFGEDSMYDHYSLDKLGVMADASLSPLQKAARLKELRQALPAEMRDNMGAAEQVQVLNDVTAQWKQTSGNAAELRAIRESMVGRPATDRLEALDREEHAWTERVSSYLRARTDLINDPTLADAVKQQRIAALRNSSFTGPDQIRAAALERIADEKVQAATTQAATH